MDPLLATDSRGNVGPGYCGGDSMFAYYFQRWCYPQFGPPQVLKDRVLWSASTLNPGTHTLTFNALAVTRGMYLSIVSSPVTLWLCDPGCFCGPSPSLAGVFRLPPVFASVVTQPEIMGMSGSGTFVVTDEAVVPNDVPALLASLNVQPLTVVRPVACSAPCGPGEAWWLTRDSGPCPLPRSFHACCPAPQGTRATSPSGRAWPKRRL